MLGHGMMQALRFAGRIRLAAIAAAVLGLALLFSVMGYGARGVLVPMGRSVVHAAGAGAADVMALLDMRSPGSRSGGALAQTKQARVVRSAVGRSPGSPAVGVADAAMLRIALGDMASSPSEIPVTDASSWLKPVGLEQAASPFEFGDWSWEYGGAWGPVGPSPGGPATGPVQSAVPEPSTWAMMILGMALVGASARRRRPSRASG